jgi:Fe-S oxidoreductase
MELYSLIFLGAFIFVLGILVWRVVELLRILKLGKPAFPIREIPKRVYLFVVNVLGQKKLFGETKPGLMHALFFWGFIVIGFDTISIFGSILFPGFVLPVIGNSIVYPYLLFLEDLFAVFVLGAIIYALTRRLILHVPRLLNSKEALIILIMILTLMITKLLMDGARLDLGEMGEYKDFLPFSYLVGLSFKSLSPTYLTYIRNTTIAIHVFILLSFIVYVPYSKHLHIMTAPFNVFFTDLSTNGVPTPIKDFEKQEKFGVETIRDFTWKDYLDMYTCTECGRCTFNCPAFLTGKELSPREFILDLKHHLFIESKKYLYGKEKPNEVKLIGNVIKEEIIWDCTTCRACENACPVFIQHVPKIIKMRQNLVMMEGKLPSSMQTALQNLETNYNPWGISSEDREQWCKDIDIKIMNKTEGKVEYLYFVGCAGSYDPRAKNIARSFVKILNEAKVDYAILGNEEKCTGDSAKRIGNEFLAEQLANDNISTFKKYNVKKIITTCPHCYNSLKNDYPSLGLENVEVIHHTDFINNLIKDNKIKLKPNKEKVTFHDSCYLARYNDIIESPREVIREVGLDLKEMPRNRKKAMCCGAGGGKLWFEEKKGTRINVARTEEAINTGAKTIVSACPYCTIMFEDGINASKSDDVKVKDLAEIVAENMAN